MEKTLFQLFPTDCDMSDKALFNIDLEKALEVIVWLAQQKPGLDIYHIAKVLFYADKKHLNKYARPVVGDTYKKMRFGPAPSCVLDIINLNGFNFSQKFLDSIESSIAVQGRNKNTTALRSPDLSYLSKSDINCLAESLSENGDRSFDVLFNVTHNERCYEETEESDYIDYRLMVDESNEHADEIKHLIFEQSKYTHC